MLHFQLIPRYKSNDSFCIIYIRAGYNYKRSHLIGVFMMRMKYCPHLPAFTDQLRTGVNNVDSRGFPWIAIVIRHVLSWVFPGCLLTAIFSRPYFEFNCREVSTFTKLNFYPLLKWQTAVWSLQLCRCEFAVRTFYGCFHFVLGSIWTHVQVIVRNLSQK